MRKPTLHPFLIILLVAAIAGGFLLLGLRFAPQRSPTAWTNGNILPNADWSSASTNIPDGWHVNGSVERADANTGYVLEGDHSLKMYGVNSFARSPSIMVQSGQRYRVGFQALVDVGTQRGTTPAQLQVWIHWIDAAGDDVRLDKQPAVSIGFDQAGSPTWTKVLVETEPAPSNADRMAISIYPLADDVLYLDDLSLNAAGVYIEPYPKGAQAAVSFSVDWETAMGGYIHSLTAPPTAAVTTGLQARQGTQNLLDLLKPYNLRATWFSNGYNFLSGNVERRTWMGDPTFTWAVSTTTRWQPIDWTRTKWFAYDPHGTVQSDPAWYFGDLVPQVQTAQQSIESHTFSHMYVGFAPVSDLQNDFAAWRDVAASQQVNPAQVLAFPFGGSDGMTAAHWLVFKQAGINTVTRTRISRTINDTKDRHLLINRSRWLPRLLPEHDVLVMPDAYLMPDRADQVQSYLQQAIAAGGMIDIYAHNHEIVAPEQIAAWQRMIKLAADDKRVWIAPMLEIANYWRGVRSIELTTTNNDDGSLKLNIENPSSYDLAGLTLMMPRSIERVDGNARFNTDRLTLNLNARSVVEITVWLKP